MKASPLAEALVELLPQSVVVRHNARDWHSATFSGSRWVIELLTSADDAAIAAFVATIDGHEFDLTGLLIADVVVSARNAGPDGATRLMVEALLLDDEV